MSSRFVLARVIAGGSAVLALASPARAQDIDIAEIFSNQRFNEENDLLQATGDVRFVADVWYLPGPADSTRALLGISLSSSALQFVRTDDGRWQAAYGVTATLEPESGSAIEKSWDRTVSVESFDETLLAGETIVFQTDMALAPGEYELALSVRDQNADHGSRVAATLDVPPLPDARLALSEPVLLRLYRPAGDDTEYIVHPSHYYPSTPERIDFLAEATGASPEQPYTMRVSLVRSGENEDKAPIAPTWTGELSPDSSGALEAFGSIQNPEAQFGEFDLVVELTDASGDVLASQSTPVMIAGSSAWIAQNWEDALRLIRYEATEDEMDILEDIEDPGARLEAWGCFWKMRDPVPTTGTNEAMVEYFQKIEVANRTWHSALRPGYQSDRGRVYVTLGAPDDIIERPVPGGPVPFEIWRYYAHNFEIVFVDRIGFNNYEIENIGEFQSELSRIERRKVDYLQDRANECPLLAPAFE